MSANTNPIYSGKPDIQWGSADGDGGTAGPLKTQNTAVDGTGTVLTVFTANATNGGFVSKLVCVPAGTNIQTVLRVFINNGSASSTIANNMPIGELTLLASTAASDTALQTMEFPIGFPLPAGYKILVTIGTTVSSGWRIGTIGGSYTA